MGTMTNRNACRGRLVLFLVALAVMAGFQTGLAESQDIEQIRQAAAQGEVDAQEERLGEYCDLSIPGGPGKDSFLAFDQELRLALSKEDPVAMSFLVYFPLRVNHEGTTIYIEDAATLQARFQETFPASVRSTVLNQKPETVFCNWSGIMYGNGRVWLRATDQRYALSTINLPDENDKDRTGRPPQLNFVCNTEAHRVAIDTDSSGHIRYRAWKVPRPVTDKPDVELSSGTLDIEGSGSCSRPVWLFTRGHTEVTVWTRGCSPDSSPPPEGRRGSLEITVGGQTRHWWCY